MNTIVKLSEASQARADSQKEQDLEDGDGGDEYKPLTPEQAREWRKSQKPVSMWRVLVWQVMAMAAAGAVAGWLTGVQSVAWSAVYGGAAVVVPSAVMAWGVTFGRLTGLLSLFAQGSLAAVVFWEGVKVLLSVAMLALAPRVVANLNWLALVAGLVLVLKVYWLAFFVSSRTAK